MEKQFILQSNGQQVQQDDLNTLGETAGLADDRVLAELLRLTPDAGTVAKAVLPYSHSTSGKQAFVEPNGASGSVVVHPFRVIIGSRTVAGTDARKNWHDIRSAISVAEGDTSLTHTINFTANVDPGPRWDIIYAAVTVDANATTTTRKVKDPTTKVVSDVSTSVFKVTNVTVTSTNGSGGSSPILPALPSDSGSTYYVPLAVVRIPNGFVSTSTVLPTDIGVYAITAPMSHALGTCSAGPADTACALTTAQQNSWGFSGTRPTTFLPSDLIGSKKIRVALDFSDASSANHSHQDGDVLDSRDWRGRVCFWRAEVYPYTQKFPWDPSLSLTATNIAFDGLAGTYGDAAFAKDKPIGAGQTIIQNFAANKAAVARLIADDLGAAMASGSTVSIYCDHSDGGKLKVSKSSTNARAILYFDLDFTAPFSNSR